MNLYNNAIYAIFEENIYHSKNKKNDLNLSSQVLYSMAVQYATNLANISCVKIKFSDKL